MSGRLFSLIAPCGPVVDAAAAERTREAAARSAAEGGWAEALEAAWPALASVFGGSPYLAGLARRRPASLGEALSTSPAERLEQILAEAHGAAATPDEAGARLRALKADAHLVIALADLGGVWTLDQVTGAMTAFADAALQAALAAAARAEAARGRLLEPTDAANPVPGLFVLAMGKHGAHELNYSSDIDISFFFEPDLFPADASVAVRLAQRVSSLLGERTAEGYVFRTDLRLRPDPGATPVAVPVPAALTYYETVGQNWERAAFIKARVAAGDPEQGAAFLEALRPFVWRRTLDHAAIADIQSIKRQIHAHKADDRLRAAGHDLKLGRGGIREIEFFAQTQQLIFGGRNPALQSRRTVEALRALADADHVNTGTAEELTEAYERLRGWEHRVQMLHDEQTHRLPEPDAERRRVAALSGHGTLKRFDAAVARTLRLVNLRYAELFADEEPLSSPFGSLVFTGVENDPETLATLERMGFSRAAQVSDLIRGWHHG
ncbi:MAG TPA: glutamine-synthetase adenylyltransferase, partial [Caulobacteraceae bacterium]